MQREEIDISVGEIPRLGMAGVLSYLQPQLRTTYTFIPLNHSIDSSNGR